MRHCPICQASYEDDARFCPDDGTPLRSSPDPYIGKLFLGQFEIREACGRGSMGAVYRAWQTSMEREVAVKVLRRDLLRDPRIVKRFRREAKASARLSHPSIITVYVVGDTDDGVPFIAMEFVKGRSLDEVLAEQGALPPLRAIHIGRQICSALAEAHSQSIVHRDLKPENIFLCPTSHTADFVKILDFGIAKLMYANEESLHTQTGAIFGTPYYLSPEQAAGADIDHRCDLYALGVILFRMLTGRLPFDKESGVAVLIQHLREKPPLPRDLVPDLPPALEKVVLRALEKDPVERWQSARDLEAALEAIQGQLQPLRAAAPAPLPGDDTLNETVTDDEKLASAVASRVASQALVATRAAAPARTVAPAVSRAIPQQRGPDTLSLAKGVTNRRRMLMHVLLGLGSVASGAGIGALLYWRRAGAARPEPTLPPPAIDAAPSDGTLPQPDAAAREPGPEAPALKQPEAKKPEAKQPAIKKPVLEKRSAKPAKKSKRPKRRTPPEHATTGPASQPSASQPVRPPRTRPPRKQEPEIAPVGPDPSVDGSDHGSDPPPEKKNDPYDMVD